MELFHDVYATHRLPKTSSGPSFVTTADGGKLEARPRTDLGWLRSMVPLGIEGVIEGITSFCRERSQASWREAKGQSSYRSNGLHSLEGDASSSSAGAAAVV